MKRAYTRLKNKLTSFADLNAKLSIHVNIKRGLHASSNSPLKNDRMHKKRAQLLGYQRALKES